MHGVFPLEVEKGRYRGVLVERRLCIVCNLGTVEDERHFLLNCPRYAIQRQSMLLNYEIRNNCDITTLPDNDKLKLLLSVDVKFVSKYIDEIWNIRTQSLQRTIR